MGLNVQYLYGSIPRRYIHDFILLVDDVYENQLHLIVEIKGYQGEDAKEKKNKIEAYWLPGVDAQGNYGRWAFAEFTDVYDIEPSPQQVIDVGENITSSTSRVVGATHILPSWSPDGTRLVFAEHRGGQEEPRTAIHIVDLEVADSLVLPQIEGHVSQVAWHPDGSEILMMVYGAGSVLRTITPDGRILTDVFKDDDRQFGWVWSHGLAWSPDGSRFAIRTDYHWVEGHGRPFFGLATANRDGDDWRIVAVGNYGGLGFSLCDWPMPDPTQLLYGGLLDDDVKKHCEPIREHRS